MGKKPTHLSDQDQAKAEELFKKGRNNELKIEEAERFLEDMKRGYEIKKFDLNDRPPVRRATRIGAFKKPRRKRLALPLYIRSGHCWPAYVRLTFYLIRKSTGEQAKKYGDSLEEDLNHLVARIEKEKKIPREDASRLGAFLAYSTWHLVFLYLLRKDTEQFLKAFYKLIRLRLGDISLQQYISDKATKYMYGGGFLLLFGYINSLSELDESTANNELDNIIFDESRAKILSAGFELASAMLDALNYGTDDEPCLILGETGTGKEGTARLIHNCSHRAENNFWAVNCGNFTESLFNSKISGVHWSGASDVGTQLGAFLKACGREKGNLGYFVKNTKVKNRGEISFKGINDTQPNGPTADDLKEVGGTLFLDEVSSLPMALQSMLLRIIQENEVQVVGEDRKRKFHIKIICASNRDFSGDEEKDQFRRDLYYRISRGIVKLPPLRDMKESIGSIALSKAKHFAKRFEYKDDISLSARAKKKLINYNWPGNFRELENVIYRAIKKLILERGSVMKPNHIEELIVQKQIINQMDQQLMDKKKDDLEKEYITFQYEKAGQNITQVAKNCGFQSRTPVYKLLDKYGLRS